MNDYPRVSHQQTAIVNNSRRSPYWADTCPCAQQQHHLSHALYHYTGKYVWHCHALDHEDLGMMRLVNVMGRKVCRLKKISGK
jgi:FtsP/CotA-like multicopper oxidase with cupredoxin domain